MTFSWLIFLTIFHYGTYAKKQSNFMYDNAYNLMQQSANQFYYPAARVSDFDNEYNDDEYYDDEDYDDDEYYNDNDDISDYYSDTNIDADDTSYTYNNDYNTQLYNQYLLNNYYNQMAYQNAYQNQMNRIYQSMLQGEQQRQAWEDINDINQQSINMDYYDLSELDWDDADEEFLKGFFGKMKKKALGWLEKKCTKTEEKIQVHLQQCAVDYPDGENALKGIPNVAFKKISNVPGLKKEQFQIFFDHCVYQLDIFLETFVKYAEGKAYDKMGLAKVPMMKTLIDGFAKALLEDDFSGIVDKVFMKLVKKIADMNGLSAPKNFEIGDAPPPKPNKEMFDLALKQFRYKDAFKKAIGWIACKFLKILERGKARFWPTEQKGAVVMIKRCGTNWFAKKLVDRVGIYATAAFDDMTKEVKWSSDMFTDWVQCLKEEGGVDFKKIETTKGKSLACVPKCFRKIDKKYNIGSGLKKGVKKAGQNALNRAKKEVDLKKLGNKLIEEGTKGAGKLMQEGIKNGLNKNSARRRGDDDWYDYYEYEN